MKQQHKKKEDQPNQPHDSEIDAKKPEPIPAKSVPVSNKIEVVEETVKQVEQVQVEKETKPIKPKEHQHRVNFKGRVGEFRKDALFRSIPITLQRNVYRETVIG